MVANYFLCPLFFRWSPACPAPDRGLEMSTLRPASVTSSTTSLSSTFKVDPWGTGCLYSAPFTPSSSSPSSSPSPSHQRPAGPYRGPKQPQQHPLSKRSVSPAEQLGPGDDQLGAALLASGSYPRDARKEHEKLLSDKDAPHEGTSRGGKPSSSKPMTKSLSFDSDRVTNAKRLYENALTAIFSSEPWRSTKAWQGTGEYGVGSPAAALYNPPPQAPNFDFSSKRHLHASAPDQNALSLSEQFLSQCSLVHTGAVVEWRLLGYCVCDPPPPNEA